MFFDFHAAQKFIEDASLHYVKSAPALVDWLEDTYIALSESPASVSVYELLQLQQLRDVTSGEWEHPNYAQNRWYKLRVSQGKDAGVISY